LALAFASSALAEPTFDGDPALLAEGAEACSNCHADVAADWSSSAHHFSSFNNPYYRVSVEEFRAERGARDSRFCAGCHEPALLATGAVDRPTVDVRSKEAQAGVTCLVCHSIDRVDLSGNGGYHARLAGAIAGPTKEAHRARFRPPILDEARLCAPCHKVGLRPDITHDRWLRGQDDWDAWLFSAASGNGAPSLFRPDVPKLCQDCHMPLRPVRLGDAAAKNGMIRSHRFLGANAALPAARGDLPHLEATRAFLDGKVTLDVRRAPDPAFADVVMHARGIGHRFPGGTMDSNQVWIEVRAFDAAGAPAGESGVASPKDDGALPSDTHLVRAQPVDGEGHPLLRRDPHHMRGVAFDASLSPSDPQAVRFRLPPGAVRLEARLYYRKFSPAYAAAACTRAAAADRARCLDIPTLEIARATLDLRAPADSDGARTLDHGLALAEAPADVAGDALPLLDAAHALLPSSALPLIGRLRALSRLGRTDDLLTPIDHPAALFVQTNALLRAYRAQPARATAEKLLARLPRDPTALLLAARARGLDGDAAASLEAADGALLADPDLAEAHYQRALALAALGRLAESEEARARWLDHRVSVETDQELRRRFLQSRGGPDESLPLHVHELH
jgi:Cytochrome c554 and c-prime